MGRKGKVIERKVTKFVDAESVMEVDEEKLSMLVKTSCLNSIAMGYSKEDAVQKAMEDHNISEMEAKACVLSAMNQLKRTYKKNRDDIAERNSARLEAVVLSAFEKKDYRTVIEAIKEQNKMFGVYTPTNTTSNVFTIKIGDDTQTITVANNTDDGD